MGLACPQTPKSKTYLVHKLMELIWQENIDVEYFVDSSTMSHFKIQLKKMFDLDPNV